MRSKLCRKLKNNAVFSCYFAVQLIFILVIASNTYSAASGSSTKTGKSTTSSSVSTTKTALPAAPASVGASGAMASGGAMGTGGGSGTVTPDMFTGTLSYSIPIEVAPGRRGMAPGVGLGYRSGGKNGWLGVGWDLEVGSIERSTKSGVDYTTEDYVLSIGGSTIDLVHIGQNEFGYAVDEYRVKIENGFSRIRKLTATDGRVSWEVTDRSGTKYSYGISSASRQDDPVDGNKIFKWCLEQVQDVNGNFMTFSYFKDQGEIYLDRIDYTGNASLPTTNYVKFWRDEGTRTDATVMYTTNFGVKTAYRLKTIEVRASGNLVRAYRLTYIPSTVTSRALLESVQQFGKDATIENGTISNEESASKLPALSFTYQGNTGLLPYANWGSGHLTSDKLGDFNGDGKMDVIQLHSNGNAYVWLSTGSGFPSYTSWGSGHLTSDKLGDFNGDGKTDVIQFYNGNAYVWLANSTGDGFLPYTNWGSGHLATDMLADFNGDGKTDVIQFINGSALVWLSTGSTFLPYTDWGSGHLATDMLADFNGDGKTDVVQFINGSALVWLSTGSTFLPYTDWGSGHLATDMLADFNGDGKTDVIQINNGYAYVWLSTGDGFQSYTDWGSGHLSTDMFGDFNGDGKTDVVQFASGYANVWLNRGPASDLISSISNGIGATTRILYKPSTEYTNHLQLPIPIQTVYSITSNDGNGHEATTTYDYQGGFYHLGEKDFRGFNHVKMYGPDDNGNGKRVITETWFHQGDETGIISETETKQNLIAYANVQVGHMKGKPYRTRAKDEQEKVYSESTIIYTTNGTAPFFSPQYQADAYTCNEVTGACTATSPGVRHIQTVFTYNNIGNLLREDHYGDIADDNDNYTVVKNYASNSDAWILGSSIKDIVYEGTYPGTEIPNLDPTDRVSQTEYYYDGIPDYDCGAVSNNQIPTKGNVTRIRRWLNGGVNPEVRMAYDPYGNLACTRDANGNPPSTVTYDGTYTFPKVATNALGHQTVTQYYGVDNMTTDNGVYGLVMSVTDPNQTTSTMQYDPLGRKIRATAPNGCQSTWSYNEFGTVGAQHVQSMTCSGATSWTYFDGFGRATRSKSQASPSGRIIVNSAEYNGNGTVKSATLPYFEGTPPGDIRSKSYTYDSLGRVTQLNNPDGTWALSCYDNGVSVTVGLLSATNNAGHRKRETTSVSGKLIKVEEYTTTHSGCSTEQLSPYATTYYEYDVLGNLLTVTDAYGNQTRMEYDTLGRKMFMHDPDMGDWTYTYDANGSLKTQTDANRQTITFFYDELNRITKKDYPTGTDVNYSYGNNPNLFNVGRVIMMTDASGTTQTGYDILGRTVSVTKTIDATAYTTLTDYDAAGRIWHITYPQDSGIVTYTYDSDGNLWMVTGSEGTTYAQYSGYNALGQPLIVLYGNGVRTEYAYEPSNHFVTEIKTSSPVQGAPLLQLNYSYDVHGNISGIVDGTNANRTQTFNYDELGRLTGAQSGAYGNLSYEYDKIGNITKKEGINYSYAATQCTPDKPHAVKGTVEDGKSYCYDYNGNMTSETGPGYVRQIQYDYDNMPQTVTLNNVTTTFAYDGAGARVKKLNPLGNSIYIGKLYECDGTSCVKYIFAGSNRIALKNNLDTFYYHADHLGSTRLVTDSRAIEISGVGTTQQYPCSGQPVRIPGTTPRYYSTIQEAYNAASDGEVIQVQGGIYNENLDLSRDITIGINGGYNCTFTSQVENSEIVGMLSDTSGKVTIGNFEIVITGYAKRTVEDSMYLPFGELRVDAGYIGVTHKYTSQEFDAETGLYYYNARYYNPKLGKFISPDTIVASFADPQTLNRYSYVVNNPIIHTDPSGHRHFWRRVANIAKWANPYIGASDAALNSSPVKSVLSTANNIVDIALRFTPYDFQWKMLDRDSYDRYGDTVRQVEFAMMMQGIGIPAPLAGGISGALSTAAAGGDISIGILGGSIGGMITPMEPFGSGYLASYCNIFLTDALRGALTGAFTTWAHGGSIRDAMRSAYEGARTSVAITTSFIMYTELTGFLPSLNSGEGLQKKDLNTSPLKGYNHIGTQGSRSYLKFFGEGGPVSRALNVVPGINAIAVIHDVFQTSMSGIWRDYVFNIPGMPVAAVITAGALMYGSPTSQYIMIKSAENK